MFDIDVGRVGKGYRNLPQLSGKFLSSKPFPSFQLDWSIPCRKVHAPLQGWTTPSLLKGTIHKIAVRQPNFSNISLILVK